MAANAIIANPVGQMLFSFVHLSLQIVRLTLYIMRPDQFSMVVQNICSFILDYITPGSEENEAIVVAFW